MTLFPLTTLIRLYELLKNSRSIREQSRESTTKQPGKRQAALVLISGKTRIVHAGQPTTWWRMTGSNRRPPACKAGALPAELIPRNINGDPYGTRTRVTAVKGRCLNRL